MTRTGTRSIALRRYVETHHVGVIPPAARHGGPLQQLVFWTGSNFNVFNVVLGAVVVSTGLTFWWALIAIGAGTLIGALLIALHATQGPRLGVPQTIQSRGQFGFYGAAWMFVAVLALNIGFIAAELVIQAQAMQGVIPGLPVPAWILILVIPSLAIGILGYRWIHHVMMLTAVIVGISVIVMLVEGLRHAALSAAETSMAAPHAGLFLAGVALLGIDLLTFGPFVSDYTRYLPADTSGTRLFAAIFAGNVTSTFISCAVGAYLAALLPTLDPVSAIGRVSGKWALLVMAFSLVNANTFNAYTGSFQVISFAGMWHRFRPESAAARIIPFTAVMAAGAVIAVLGYHDFVANLSNFLDVLLVLFIPWSAVNIIDFYVVRHGRYDVAAFFDRDGGPYGKVAWRGLLAYAVGLAAEWPFVYQPDYTGPLVDRLGGSDISWVIGWIVPAGVYYALASRERRQSMSSLAAGHASRAN
jgi:NCS1 family nucleobase:cation symporter-1